ncbi:MAG: amidohydrolase family protein [Candidatus Thermoplasmatota archaeon]
MTDAHWRHGGIGVIDGHVHVNRFDLMRPAAQEVIRSNPTFAQMERFVASPEAFLAHMDAEGVEQSWLINYCAKEVMGYGPEVNAWVASYVDADPRRLVAVGGVEVDDATEAAIEQLRDLGIRALKIHTVHQHVRPDDERLAEAFAACERHRMPVIFHTGTSRFPGADNHFADPAPIDAVCKRHPKLPVILAHGGRPDQTQAALDIVARHTNAWLDLSSCPPHRLGDYFGDLEALAPRTLWGSDWPGPGVPGMGANIEAFLALRLSERTNRLILRDNAKSLLR